MQQKNIKTYNMKTPFYSGNTPFQKTITETREEKGSSNAGKYKNVEKSDFCGPAGGAAEGTYPVNSLKRAKSALKLAHNAPNPQGIKNCVYSKFPELKPKK